MFSIYCLYNFRFIKAVGINFFHFAMIFKLLLMSKYYVQHVKKPLFIFFHQNYSINHVEEAVTRDDSLSFLAHERIDNKKNAQGM